MSSTPMECPKCKADLRGEKIHEKYKHLYPSGREYYSKVIGVSDPYLDRVTHWLCPICAHEWERAVACLIH